MGFLLLSTQRSMSTFFMNILRAHPKVHLLNEPLSQHIQKFRDEDLFESQDFSLTNKFDEKNRYAFEYIDSLKKWIKQTPLNVGFKEVLLLNKMDWVLETFPNYKIIILLRDPRGIVEALVRRNLDLRWDFKTLLKNYVANVDPNIIGDCFPENRLEITALIWKIRITPLINYLEANREMENLIVVKSESIVENITEQLALIMPFLGETDARSQTRYANDCWASERGGIFSDYHKKSRLHEWKNKLSSKDIRIIERITKEQMERIGYIPLS